MFIFYFEFHLFRLTMVREFLKTIKRKVHISKRVKLTFELGCTGQIDLDCTNKYGEWRRLLTGICLIQYIYTRYRYLLALKQEIIFGNEKDKTWVVTAAYDSYESHSQPGVLKKKAWIYFDLRDEAKIPDP